MGWIGGKEIRLADVEIAATTRNATVAVQSLDESAISKSRAILISLGARSVPKTANQLPFHSEPVTGRLTIRAPKGLKLTARPGLARDEREIPAIYEGGRYHIALDPQPRHLLAAIEVAARTSVRPEHVNGLLVSSYRLPGDRFWCIMIATILPGLPSKTRCQRVVVE